MSDNPPEDPRPRPAYGEYATPEEQRAAIREPAPETASVPSVSAAPIVEPARPARSGAARPARATTRAATPTRAADRIVTFALLAYGLFTVIGAVPQLWHFTELAQTALDLAGVDATFTNTAQGDIWGPVGAIVYILGWLVTAALSWVSVSRGRISWWIPLVGAIVTSLAVTVCLTIPLFGDPALIAGLAG